MTMHRIRMEPPAWRLGPYTITRNDAPSWHLALYQVYRSGVRVGCYGSLGQARAICERAADA